MGVLSGVESRVVEVREVSWGKDEVRRGGHLFLDPWEVGNYCRVLQLASWDSGRVVLAAMR